MIDLVILILFYLTNCISKYCWSKFKKKVNDIICLRTELVYYFA